MEESTTIMAEAAQDTAQQASSEPTNEQLTAEIKVYLGQIGQNIIEVGKRLNIMKGRLSHGEWQTWLSDNFNLSQQTARKFMQVYERFGKTRIDTRFGSTQMIAMLALPEDETEQFIEAKAAAGTPVEDMTVKKLREEIQQWKARAEDADKKIAASNEELRESQSNLQDARTALNEVIKDRASIAKERDAAISAARDAEEKLQNQQPQVVIQAPDDYDATKQALKDEQARNQQLQEQLADRPVEVTVPADYHDNKKALADAQEELASNRKALSDANEQISNMLLEKQTQDAERLSAEEYAVAAKDLDTISALLIDLVYKKNAKPQ